MKRDISGKANRPAPGPQSCRHYTIKKRASAVQETILLVSSLKFGTVPEIFVLLQELFISLFPCARVAIYTNKQPLDCPWLKFSLNSFPIESHSCHKIWHCLHSPCVCIKYFLSTWYYCLCFVVFERGNKTERRVALKSKTTQLWTFRYGMTALEYRDAAEPSFILSNCHLYQNSKVLTPVGRGGRKAGTRLEECYGAKIQVLSI